MSENFNPKQCAEYLGIGMNSMLKLLHSNNFIGFKIGNKWIVNKEALDKWIKEKSFSKLDKK